MFSQRSGSTPLTVGADSFITNRPLAAEGSRKRHNDARCGVLPFDAWLFTFSLSQPGSSLPRFLPFAWLSLSNSPHPHLRSCTEGENQGERNAATLLKEVLIGAQGSRASPLFAESLSSLWER